MASQHPSKLQPRVGDYKARIQFPPLSLPRQPPHAASSKSLPTVNGGIAAPRRGVLLPLATAGNYSHLLANMDKRMMRNKKQLSALHNLPMKFPAIQNGQSQNTDQSGIRQGSASSRNSKRIVPPILQEPSYNHRSNGDIALAPMARVSMGKAVESDILLARITAAAAELIDGVRKRAVVQVHKKSVSAVAKAAVPAQAEDSDEGEENENEAKSPPKTEAELQEEMKTILKKLSVLYKTTGTMLHVGEHELYTEYLLTKMESVEQSYFKFSNLPLKLMCKGRQEAGKLLVEHGVIPVLCDIVILGLESQDYMSAEEELIWKPWSRLDRALSSIVNFTDASDDVTYVIRDHERFLSVLLTKIKDWFPLDMNDALHEAEVYLLSMCLTVIHNTAMRDDNIQRLRQLNTSKVLLLYLQTSNEENKLSVIASLADIVNEEEADMLAATPETARFLLNRLKRAFLDEKHRFEGWCVTELVRAVRQLGRNDANKQVLVEEDALPLLAEGIQSNLDDEKTECMQCLWVLSFDSRNKGEMVKDESLLDQVASGFHDHSQPRACRQAAQGILWQLREELTKMDKYREIGKAFQTKPQADTKSSASKVQVQKVQPADGPIAKAPTGHVMLSYQWADQELVKTIRDHLHAEGFTVWMDIDNMEGSTLQAMAEAIEHAFVVLVCMSQKYKDSPNCRAESEYAFKQRKNIIPLFMQLGYQPDGWLGMILGAKLFFDFSGKYLFESRMSLLKKAVWAAAGRKGGFDDVDGHPSEQPTRQVEGNTSQTVVYSSALSRAPHQILNTVEAATITKWNHDNIHNWLKEHSLDGTELERLTGKEIVFLHNLRNEAPEFFYNTLEKKLQIGTLSGLMSFTDALNDLPLA